ncbi:MAG: hypothetical protein P8L21_04105 [Polaribacter sp.]|jgi:hypothetical protein|nr:hypothetical protein [Polaribacter sp.]
MKKTSELLYKKIENQTIAWFENSNKYVVLEDTTADILKKLSSGISVKEIAQELSQKHRIPTDTAENFILDFQKKVNNQKENIEKQLTKYHKEIKTPESYAIIEYYKVNDLIFKVSYLSEKERSLVHPKFAHLAIEPSTSFDNEFEVFIHDKFIYLFVDKNLIGAWTNNDVHYFQGKFSMEFIQKIHRKEEHEWMGVFHASAVSNGKKSILFLGDSGNGKSTSLALLQANGFTCLADDFVPIDVKKQQVYSFPAAISIKKSSLKTLLPFYPELATTTEYNFEQLQKIVRYLKPNNDSYFNHLPCEDLIFIKYEKEADLSCEKISNIKAFQQLIPDSWLSPKKENATVFLDWFETLNCYQITYSKNKKMIQAVSKIFTNDL